MTLDLSEHAVERYIERCAPHMSMREARHLLRRNLGRATLLRERTPRGHLRYRLDHPACVLVVRESRYQDEARRIVITILATEVRASEVVDEQPSEADDEPAYLTVPQALAQVSELLAKQEDRAAAEQHADLACLLPELGPVSHVPAALLRQGYEWICAPIEQSKKLRQVKRRLVRDHLRQLCPDEDAPADRVAWLWERVSEIVTARAACAQRMGDADAPRWTRQMSTWQADLMTIQTRSEG